MAVVLDLAAHPPGDRSDLVHEVIASSGARRRVALNASVDAVDLRAETWQLGATRVLRTTGTGLTLTRTEQDVRREAPDLVAIALSPGRCAYSVNGSTQVLGRGGLVLVDFGTPYSFSHGGPTGSSFTAHIPYADLGLDVDVVRAAIPRLRSSPLLPLVSGHLRRVSATIDDVVAASSGSANLGLATADLTRALIASAAGRPAGRDVLRDTLRAQVVAYVEEHLRDRDLTPARIAAEHHVSLRTLYNVWGDQDAGLVEWIIQQRLDRVRRELAVRGPGASVFAVARSWGFVDPTHFTRRFRGAYGTTPAQWLRRLTPPVADAPAAIARGASRKPPGTAG